LTHRKVVGREVFFLNNHVIEDGLFANHDFRYWTAQRGCAVANVLLHHRCPASGFGDDQDTGSAQSCSLPGPGNKDDLDRPIQLHPGRHVNEGAVGNERGVEGGEWMLRERRQTAEVLGHSLGS